MHAFKVQYHLKRQSNLTN